MLLLSHHLSPSVVWTEQIIGPHHRLKNVHGKEYYCVCIFDAKLMFPQFWCVNQISSQILQWSCSYMPRMFFWEYTFLFLLRCRDMKQEGPSRKEGWSDSSASPFSAKVSEQIEAEKCYFRPQTRRVVFGREYTAQNHAKERTAELWSITAIHVEHEGRTPWWLRNSSLVTEGTHLYNKFIKSKIAVLLTKTCVAGNRRKPNEVAYVFILFWWQQTPLNKGKSGAWMDGQPSMPQPRINSAKLQTWVFIISRLSMIDFVDKHQHPDKYA